MATFRNTGTSGCRHVNASDGQLNGLSWYAFVTQEDTTLTHLRVRNKENNEIDRMGTYGLTNKTLTVGAYIPVPDGETISAITVATGSVIGYIE